MTLTNNAEPGTMPIDSNATARAAGANILNPVRPMTCLAIAITDEIRGNKRRKTITLIGMPRCIAIRIAYCTKFVIDGVVICLESIIDVSSL